MTPRKRRPAPPSLDSVATGPFTTERDLRGPGGDHLFDVVRGYRPGDREFEVPGDPGRMETVALEWLEKVCTDAGIELADYDRQVLEHLTRRDLSELQVIGSLIARARRR